MLRYMACRSGPMASTYDLTAFIKTRAGLAQPDAQILFWGLSVDKSVHDRVKVEDHPDILE